MDGAMRAGLGLPNSASPPDIDASGRGMNTPAPDIDITAFDIDVTRGHMNITRS
jgi:hypothetical protein